MNGLVKYDAGCNRTSLVLPENLDKEAWRMPKEPVFKRRGSCGVSLRMSTIRLSIPSGQNSFILRRFHQGEQPPFA